MRDGLKVVDSRNIYGRHVHLIDTMRTYIHLFVAGDNRQHGHCSPDHISFGFSNHDHWHQLLQGNFAVPPEAVAAFQAGEPVQPLLDYLLERYGGSHPWLHEAVAAMAATLALPAAR